MLDNLRAEHGISSNDAPHRLTAAIIVDLPFGRDRWIGRGMNRVLDAIVGGWALNSVVTLQSGQPMALYNQRGLLADGNQRPNVICSQLSTGLSYREAAEYGRECPESGLLWRSRRQIPGNAPRHFSNLRGDGIRNLDMSLSKEFKIREGKCSRCARKCSMPSIISALPSRISGREMELWAGHFHDQQLPQNAVRSAVPVLEELSDASFRQNLIIAEAGSAPYRYYSPQSASPAIEGLNYATKIFPEGRRGITLAAGFGAPSLCWRTFLPTISTSTISAAGRRSRIGFIRGHSLPTTIPVGMWSWR